MEFIPSRCAGYEERASGWTTPVREIITIGMILSFLQTADPGFASLILALSHTFLKIDPEMISTAIINPSADSRRLVVSYQWKYVHEVLVNGLVKLAQEKCGVRWTDHPDMTKLLTGMLSMKPNIKYSTVKHLYLVGIFIWRYWR